MVAVIAVAMSAVMVTFVIMISAMIMVLVVPVAFVVFPASIIVVVVRMAPISPGKWRTLPVSCNPTIVVADWSPVPIYPAVIWTWCRLDLLIADRWRGYFYINRDLCRSGNADCDYE